jgi:5-bromo-4-chloroindolyl phosphate hydrolysis protein
MPAITKEDTISFNELFKKSYTYLNDNFHKFKQTNKIQIAIAVCKMAVTQKFEGMNQTIVVSATIQKQIPGEPENTNRIAEYFKRGSPDSPTTT